MSNTFPDGFPQTPLEAIEFSYFLEDKQEWYDWLNSANAEEQSELVSILHNMWIEEQANVIPETLSSPAMPIFVPEVIAQIAQPEIFVAPELPILPVMPSFEFQAPTITPSFVAPELPAMPSFNMQSASDQVPLLEQVPQVQNNLPSVEFQSPTITPSFVAPVVPQFVPQVAQEIAQEEATEIPSFDANPVFEDNNNFTPISQETPIAQDDFVFDDFEEDKVTLPIVGESVPLITPMTFTEEETVEEILSVPKEEDDYIDFNFDEEDEEDYSSGEIGTVATVNADQFASDLEQVVENKTLEEPILDESLAENFSFDEEDNQKDEKEFKINSDAVSDFAPAVAPVIVPIPKIIPDYDGDIDTTLANNFSQIQELDTPTELDHSVFSGLLADYNTQVATQNETFVKVLEAMYEQQQTFINTIDKKQNEAVSILNNSVSSIQGLSNNIQALYAKVEELEQKLMDINSVVIGHTQSHAAQERTNIDVQDQVADLQYSMEKSSQGIQSLRARTNEELKRIHQQVAGDKADIYRQDGGELRKALDVLTKQVSMLRSQRPTPANTLADLRNKKEAQI